MAARPLSTVAHLLSGLDLLFMTILKTQFFYGIFVTFISVIGIRVTYYCMNSFNMTVVKRAQIIWTCVATTLIALTLIIAIVLPRVMSLGTLEVLDTFERGITQYLSDSSWKSRIDGMQQQLKCCGITDQEDWLKGRWVPVFSLKAAAFTPELIAVDGRISKPVLPASCCSPYYDVPCIHDYLQQQHMSKQKDMSSFLEGVYPNGCIGTLLDPILTSVISFSVITILISIFQTGELIIASILYFICTRQ